MPRTRAPRTRLGGSSSKRADTTTPEKPAFKSGSGVSGFAELAIFPLAVETNLPKSGGEPLSAALSDRLEQVTGERPHEAHVHEGPVSATASAILGARAFTLGTDIHLGPNVARDDEAVLAHEAAHTLQQRPEPSNRTSSTSALEAQAADVSTAVRFGGIVPVTHRAAPGTIQRDVVTDIESTLSYGVFDWAITDGDANRVLALLESVPAAQLAGTLGELGQDFIDRLLDNIPESSRARPIYAQIIAALGPAGIRHEVESLLSYDLFDWEITEAEANQVLDMLDRLAPGNLQAAVQNLGEPYVARLLENVSESARTRPIYGQLVSTLGRQGVLPYLETLLTTGIFQLDLAVTDSDATNVLLTMARFSSADQRMLLKRLNDHHYLATLVGNMTADGHVRLGGVIQTYPAIASLTAEDKAVLKVMFDACPDNYVATLDLLFEKRFDVDVGPYSGTIIDDDTNLPLTPRQFEADGLRKSWETLESLPAAHVELNPQLDRFERYEARPGLGYYEPSGDRIAVAYRPTDSVDNEQFENIILHEVGHAVDANIHASSGYVATPAGGSWLDHPSTTVLSLILQHSNSVISHWPNAAQKTALENVLAQAISTRDEAKTTTRGSTAAAFRALAFWSTLTGAQRESILEDRGVTAVVTGLQSPWWNEDGGITLLDGRIYQEAYPHAWVSYAATARDRKVSLYQFRAAPEWFAEAYVAYYDPDSDPRGEELEEHDRATKIWFDANVHV